MEKREKEVSSKVSVPIVNPAPNVKICVSPEEKDVLRQMSHLSLWLDSYDDLFSDFDPRPHSERALSDDFISAAKKIIREKKTGKVQLNLLVPADKRNPGHETKIKKRLREYFKKQFAFFHKERLKKLKQGSIFSVVGVIVMLTATLLLFKGGDKTLWISFLIILLEPAGWFLFWEGLNQMIFDSNKKNPALEFNKKLSSCEIVFSSY